MAKYRKALLSDREYECLFWIAQGKTYSEIAMIVDLSFGTIKTYLDSARRKLNDSVNLPQAVFVASQSGLFNNDKRLNNRCAICHRFYVEQNCQHDYMPQGELFSDIDMGTKLKKEPAHDQKPKESKNREEK